MLCDLSGKRTPLNCKNYENYFPKTMVLLGCLAGVCESAHGQSGSVTTPPGTIDCTDRLLGRLRHIPIWAFHGDRDESISIEWSRKMVAAARKYNPQVDFTVYEGGDHHIYFDVYRRQDLYDWFLLHTRHHHPIADPVDPSILRRYTGKYITDQSWPTMEIVLDEKGKLTVWGGELLSIAGNRFVQSTVAPGYVEFLPNPDNGRMELHWRFTQYEGATLFWKE